MQDGERIKHLVRQAFWIGLVNGLKFCAIFYFVVWTLVHFQILEKIGRWFGR